MHDLFLYPSHNEVCSAEIFHIKFGGKLSLHILYNIFVVSNQQHVINIKRYVNEVITNLFGIYIVLNFASHKPQSKYARVKILVPHPWRLLQIIKGLLWIIDHLFPSRYCKTFWLFHVDLFFKFPM